MTKKEMIKTIAKDCNGRDIDKIKAVKQALDDHKLPFIKKIYRFYRSHPEMAGLCLHLLTGMEFSTKEKEESLIPRRF